MKRTFLVIGVLLVLLAAYAIWPLVGLQKIVAAAQARDTIELSQRIDPIALKQSLIGQIGRTYLRVSGKDHGLSDLEIRLALRVAAAMAGPQVDEMLKPDRLLELLQQSGTEQYGQLGQVGLPRLEAPNFRNVFEIVRNTEYSGTKFSVLLPLASDEETGYRLHLTLQGTTWKLSGIGLPATVQTRIATDIYKTQAAKG